MRMRIPAVALIVVASAIGMNAVRAQTPPPQAVAKSPTVKVLHPPDFWGEYAIWGATGVNKAGKIFLGMTSNDERGSGSAHLFEFNPTTEAFVDRGNVVSELQRLGLRRPRETQMKIHSRIVEAVDGYQYFSSMDESGEADDGSKLPMWGGHLWRRGPTGVWEHLAATKEALIAVATGGPYVYSLGYFNAVLYQFDTRTRKIRSVIIGAAGGHVTRNFFVDDRGHAFVPRTVKTGAASATAALVELDTSLVEVGNYPLAEYFEGPPDSSHGIVAVAPDGSRGWYFTTGNGRLYRVEPKATGPSALTDLGWIHPAGSRYAPSIFRDEQTGVIYGVTYLNSSGSQGFEWITRPVNGQTTVAPLLYGDVPFPTGAVLYGSITRDLAGRFYVVGLMNYKPVILQVTPAK
jgi:hypothetical protein